MVVLGASGLSAQVLKNLVLPGLGSFTVCDDARVNWDDVRSNFFLDAESVGKSYAEELARLVQELNPATEAMAWPDSPTSVIEQQRDLLMQSTLIICVRQPRHVCEAVADLAWHYVPPVPVLTVRDSGFQGELCISLGELGIMETHPDSLVDLRLTRPFPELVAYAQHYGVDAGDSLAVSHIPFVVLILRALGAWREAHNGEMPTTAERRAFVQALQDARANDEADRENVEEALAALAQHVWRPLQSPPVPAHVTALLDDTQCRSLSARTPAFWLLVATLRVFVEKEGVLPLTGALPDMKSLSLEYAALQRVYVSRARRDFAVFDEMLDRILEQVGTTRDQKDLDGETVRTFVKHAAFLQLIRGRRLTLQRTDPNVVAFEAAFNDPVNPVIAQYHLAFVGVDTFYEQMQRYPGGNSDWQDDADLVYTHASAYAARIGLTLTEGSAAKLRNACVELTRGAMSDTPSTAALLGGITAQEAIKIITRQYVPLDNTCVYDGITQAVSSLRL